MERIIRNENWELQLAKALQESKSVEFEYGVADCTTWSAYMVSQYTNFTWEPTWANEEEALSQQASRPMEEQVSEILGQQPKHILTKVKRGDVVQKGTGMDAALGIYVGQGKVAFISFKGLVYFPIQACKYYWEI